MFRPLTGAAGPRKGPTRLAPGTRDGDGRSDSDGHHRAVRLGLVISRAATRSSKRANPWESSQRTIRTFTDYRHCPLSILRCPFASACSALFIYHTTYWETESAGGGYCRINISIAIIPTGITQRKIMISTLLGRRSARGPIIAFSIDIV